MRKIQDLIDKYKKLQKQKYETITLTQVLNDLYQLQRANLRYKK